MYYVRMGISKYFKDDKGHIIIGQRPNIPVYFAIFAYIVRFIPLKYLYELSELGFSVAMIYWSYLEIRYGINTFRRVLGIVVLSYILYRQV